MVRLFLNWVIAVGAVLLVCSTTTVASATNVSSQVESLATKVEEDTTVVTGRVVVAEKGDAIGYATVAATRNNEVLTATASDINGVFSLQIKATGELTIEVSAVGYTSAIRPLNAMGEEISLGDVALTEGVEVDAVVLTVQKPIVVTDAEKTAYSVEDDPEAQSSTLEEIIRKVPQLSIDSEGKVLLNGQSDYKILVNGRTSPSMSRNFSDLIKSMPASSIKRIEVITNPSMKYEAEGMGGILNIITSKNHFDGYNGSVNSSATSFLNRNWQTNHSANFSFQTNKFTLSAGLFYWQAWQDNDEVFSNTSHLTNTADDIGYKHQTSKHNCGYNALNLYGEIEASYQIDSLNLLTAEITGWGGHSKLRGNSHYSYLDSNRALLYGYDELTHNLSGWNGIDASVAYEHTFKNAGHTLTVSDNISVNLPAEYSSTNDVVPFEESPAELAQQTRVTTKYHEYYNALQVDYTNPVAKHHNIEAGAKHDFSSSYLAQQSLVPSMSLNSNGGTRLNKNVLGLYAGYTFALDKFSLRAGTRLEGAWYKVRNITDGEKKPYNSQLFDIVPYISLTYTPKQGHNLSLSYTDRLSRPNIDAMSPFEQRSLTTCEKGNPNLKTGINHTINLSYSYSSNKFNLTARAISGFSFNRVANYSYVDSEGIFVTTYANNGKMQFYTLNASVSWRPSTKFNLSASISGGWGEHTLPSEGIRTVGYYLSQSLNLNIALWKGARLTLTEQLNKYEPQLGSQVKNFVVGSSARLGQKFLKDKLEVALSVSNPHAPYSTYKKVSVAPSYYMMQDNFFYDRSIRLSISYRFGNNNIAVKSTNRKRDDGGDSVGTSRGGKEGM